MRLFLIEVRNACDILWFLSWRIPGNRTQASGIVSACLISSAFLGCFDHPWPVDLRYSSQLSKEIHPWGHCSGIKKWLKFWWFGGSIAAAHRSAHQLPRDRGCCLWVWRIKQLNWIVMSTPMLWTNLMFFQNMIMIYVNCIAMPRNDVYIPFVPLLYTYCHILYRTILLVFVGAIQCQSMIINATFYDARTAIAVGAMDRFVAWGNLFYYNISYLADSVYNRNSLSRVLKFRWLKVVYTNYLGTALIGAWWF